MRAFRTMFATEMKLVIRGMDMVIFGIIMPLAVMIILGIVYGEKPAFEGAGYTFFSQSFGAVAAIAICASGVMGLPIIVADYRNKKILKRFKVTPISPLMLLLVHVMVYAVISLLSLVLLFLVGRIFFGLELVGAWYLFLGTYLLVLLSMFSLGMMVGAVSPNIKTSNLLCSLLYFPMLIFSGTTLPYEVMPKALQRVADIMPLTQGIKLMKAAAFGLPAGDVRLPLLVMIALAAVCTAASIRFFRWE